MSIKEIKIPAEYTLENITICDTCKEEIICAPYEISCGYGSPSDMSTFHYCSTNCFFEGATNLYLHDSQCNALDNAIERGIADSTAGRVHSINDVRAEILSPPTPQDMTMDLQANRFHADPFNNFMHKFFPSTFHVYSDAEIESLTKTLHKIYNSAQDSDECTESLRKFFDEIKLGNDGKIPKIKEWKTFRKQARLDKGNI